MIVDASALLSITLGEADRLHFLEALDRSDGGTMSVVNYVEAGIRTDRDPDPERGVFLNELMARFNIEIVPVTPEQGRIAREAHRRYGKGRHDARLNLGDCFAYALARARDEPLLYKGEDFAKTDIEAAA